VDTGENDQCHRGKPVQYDTPFGTIIKFSKGFKEASKTFIFFSPQPGRIKILNQLRMAAKKF
jgi:hypothetical protein